MTAVFLTFIGYSLLTILNFWYLFTYILKKNDKTFHLIMFVLIQSCYTCYILTACFTFYLFPKANEESINWKFYNLSISFGGLAILFNNITQAIFAMKYWVLSKKIEEIISQKSFNNLENFSKYLY